MKSAGFQCWLILFLITQSNKLITDITNKLNKLKLRTTTSISILNFSTLFTKSPHNKILMVPDSLIDFFTDTGESKKITANSYRAC